MCVCAYTGLLISLWLFLFAAPKEFLLDGLKRLEQRSHKCVELGGICKFIFFNPVAFCFLYKAKDLSAPLIYVCSASVCACQWPSGCMCSGRNLKMWLYPSLCMVSTDNPVTEQFICIIALKGHLENTVSLNMHAVWTWQVLDRQHRINIIFVQGSTFNTHWNTTVYCWHLLVIV
jgi:hypothetical protein